MADIMGPLRPSDSWSTTEVRSISHSHVWTIRGFSQCDVRYLETTVKIKDTKEGPAMLVPPSSSTMDSSAPITFRIRLHPQGNKESNKDFSFFQVFEVFCNQNNTKYRAKFTVFNVRNEEIPTTVYTGTQQLHGYFEYIRRDLLCSHVLPSDELQLVLTLTVTFDTITRCSQTPRCNSHIEPRISEVTQNLELFYNSGKLTDFVIELADNKELKVHKAVIAARSMVFAAMLEPHTEEWRSGRVKIEGVDYEVMQEMMMYIYTGRAPNLQTMGLELLAVADRFNLPGLKEMAEQHLRNSLMLDTVCRVLVYADMHHATDLKADAIRFIAGNSSSIVTTDGWNEMLREHPERINEVIPAITDSRNAMPNLDMPSSAKRARLDFPPSSSSASTSTIGTNGGAIAGSSSNH